MVKPNLNDLLDKPKADIKRGKGVQLSTDIPTKEDVAEPIISKTHNRINAVSQDKPKRVNRGYMLREDIIKQCKLLALQQGKALYEVMEAALTEYLDKNLIREI
ncbi:MAG: hypothetical protein ACRDIV_13870 [Ktedonobacteraceae bacterium]